MSETTEADEAPRAPRARAAARRWRDVIESVGRAERQRLLPLPLAFAALLLPIVAAWATASDDVERGPARYERGARPLPDALSALSRDTRLPDEGAGYVDVWGALAPWEEAHLARSEARTAPPRR